MEVAQRESQEEGIKEGNACSINKARMRSAVQPAQSAHCSHTARTDTAPYRMHMPKWRPTSRGHGQHMAALKKMHPLLRRYEKSKKQEDRKTKENEI